MRYIGYATGSAVSAAVLDAHTAPHRSLPSGAGYDDVALIGSALWLVCAVASFLLPRGRSAAPVDEVLADESIADAIPSDEDADKPPSA